MSNPIPIPSISISWTKAQPAVASYISALVPDFHTAEDILQAVAVVVVKKYAEYDPSQPFLGCAIGIARYEVLHYRRSKARVGRRRGPTGSVSRVGQVLKLPFYGGNQMRIMKTASLLVALGGIAIAGSAGADVIVNFDGSQAGASAATGSPFGIAAASWTNTGDVAEDLVGISVGATTVTWTSANTWGDDVAGTTDDESVYGGYLDDSAAAVPSVTVTGLDAEFGVGASYVVTIYGFSDDAGNIVGNYIIDGTTVAAVSTASTGGLTGNYGIATLTTSGNSLTFAGELDGTNAARSTISGFTITEVPEPGSLALLGLGGLAVLRRRRG